MLRRCLPAVAPATFADWNLSREFGKEDDLSGTGLIPYFFQLIGKALYIDAVEQPVAPPPNQEYMTGEILFANTSGKHVISVSKFGRTCDVNALLIN